MRLAVQLEDAELWSALIGANDYAEHAPTGVEGVTVKRGDRLYFRFGSRYDGAHDQASWDPKIAYTGTDGAADATNVNGLNPYTYSASADFALAGRASTVTAPVAGTVHRSGALTKKSATPRRAAPAGSSRGRPAGRSGRASGSTPRSVASAGGAPGRIPVQRRGLLRNA